MVGAQCRLHAAHLGPCRVVKRRVGAIAVLVVSSTVRRSKSAGEQLEPWPEGAGTGNDEHRKEPRWLTMSKSRTAGSTRARTRR